MLRHFAALTAVATACLAIFASGENSNALQAASQVNNPGKAGDASVLAGQLAKGRREVREIGGLRLAQGTRLGYQQQPDYDVEKNLGPTEGHIQYDDPASANAADLAAAAPSPAPVEMVRDPSGIPAPGTTTALKRPPAGRQQAPRRATRQDYERMIAESERRSGAPGVGGAE